MQANKLIPRLWILYSLFISIHVYGQYPTGQETGETQYIIGYEYAFNDGDGLTFVSITPTTDFNLTIDVNTNALTSDNNVLHIRFLDDAGKWSAILSHIFIRPPEIENADKNIIGYEYTFNDGDTLQYVAVTPTQDFNLITDIDISSLEHNINVLHIRFKDDLGMWSSMLSHMFITPPEVENPDKNIIGYEYAFNDGDDLQYVAVTPTQDFNLITDIDISSLEHDINVFHIRFLDDSSMWSSMLSHIFITPPEVENPDKNIVGYEYAFNDGDDLQYVSVTPTQDFNLITDIDISSLEHDINVFHIRFLDDSNMWSSMLSHIFIKPPEIENPDKNIIGYEYAFNDGDALQYVAVTPTQDFNLITDIDISSLEHDINVFHIRFLDDSNMWSSMLSHIFIKPPEVANPDKKIVGYEYAFNNETYQYTSITPTDDYNLIADIDISSLEQNINTFQIRFLDDSGMWSSMLSHLFINSPESDVLTDNKLVSYEYWFDHDVTNKRSIDISPDVLDLVVTELDMTHIWRGERRIHSQYKDNHGKYSLVMTDTIIKNSLPIAAFEADQTEICVGNMVNFTDAGSIDYDTYTWNFDDGETSTDIDVSHTFTNAGTYDVSLTVVDTNISVDSVFVRTITVVDYPLSTVSITGEIPACFGDVVTLTADDPDASYTWSNGETTQSIEVTEAGTYNVELSHTSGTSCNILSDDIEVTFYPEIDNTIAVQSYPLVLTANQTAATYQWIDCTNGNIPIDGATNIDYEPTVNGDYAVEVTQNGCTVTSDCEVITTISIADYAIKQLVQLYPNPAQDVLNIRTEVPILLQLFNTNGLVVTEFEMPIGEQTIVIDYLSSGLYFSKVIVLSGEWSNQHSIYKIVKQ